MNTINVSIIEWNSSHYLRCLALRNEQLRRDEGLEDLLIAPQEEACCTHLAAVCDGEVVGAMHLVPVDEDEVRIKQVVVARTHRGYGIGATMIAFAERLAREWGYKLLTLNGKIEAWGFYERIGFTSCGAAYDWLATTVKPYRKVLEADPVPSAAARRPERALTAR